MEFNEPANDLLDHLTDPCPLGCGSDDFNWWPIEIREQAGPIYAYDCPACGAFVVPAEEREWLLRRGADFSLQELRSWLAEENRSAQSLDYQRWPWLTHDLLLLFQRQLMRA